MDKKEKKKWVGKLSQNLVMDFFLKLAKHLTGTFQ